MPTDPPPPARPSGSRNPADVISSDEVDALLDGVRSGAVATDSGHAAAGPVRPYDFAAGEHVVRGRLAALDLIDERFVRSLRANLERLVHRQLEVSCQGAQHQRFADALGAVRAPAAIYVVSLRPLGCQALVVLDAALVAALTDAFYGGRGGDLRHDAGAEFTPAEWRLARKCFDASVAELRAAWAGVASLEIDLVRTETNPQFAAIVAASEPILVRRYRLTLESTGEIAMILPLVGLASVREQLQALGVARPDRPYRQDLEAALKDSVLQLETVFSRLEITLGTLVRLRPGDILEINRPDTVAVLAEGQPVFTARYGVSSGRNAVQVLAPAPRPQTAAAPPPRRMQ
ncbi:MAG TPA: FliM/FliN family flagellar motor switch protein [Steroidobacteraceae bacterium]|nr:FliM/FliN family flagellar motor switch protein [Steroidobacteraceae bacterium]